MSDSRALTDYAWAERAIRTVSTNRESQPDVALLARDMGVSPQRFSRAFKRWCGLSPKQFLGMLRLADAKAQLRDSVSVLDAALNTGLSGPSRLHDLFVQIDGITPGEFNGAAAAPDIEFGVGLSPFGRCLIGWTARGVCHLAFLSGSSRDEIRRISSGWPGSALVRDDDAARNWIDRVFDARRPWRDGLHLRGTNFQMKVWQALLAIPDGSVASYLWVAEAIGRPSASRAVGAAIGANPVAYLVPCHRVLRSDGQLGGYRWGTDRKRAILAWEHLRA